MRVVLSPKALPPLQTHVSPASPVTCLRFTSHPVDQSLLPPAGTSRHVARRRRTRQTKKSFPRLYKKSKKRGKAMSVSQKDGGIAFGAALLVHELDSVLNNYQLRRKMLMYHVKLLLSPSDNLFLMKLQAK
jgi:hypothetical protein